MSRIAPGPRPSGSPQSNTLWGAPSPGKERWSLIPHASSGAVENIAVIIRRPEPNALRLAWRMAGNVDSIAWPEPAPHAFADLLWQHSCFEAFVGAEGEAGYREFNLSPSSRFAVYAFDGHRSGMRRADDAAVVEQYFSRSGDIAEMQAVVRLDGLADAACWDVGLTAVVEERSGAKTYWALAHPDGPPDFHNRDCFVARLPAPDGP